MINLDNHLNTLRKISKLEKHNICNPNAKTYMLYKYFFLNDIIYRYEVYTVYLIIMND